MYYIGLSTYMKSPHIISGPYRGIPSVRPGENIYKEENGMYILQPERTCGICGELFFGTTYYCSKRCEAEAKQEDEDLAEGWEFVADGH
jgi:hypothetical protein